MTPVVYLNRRFLPVSEAHVSVMDRGFLFGDGVYEVIPSVDGQPVFLELHLQRLDANLKALGINYHPRLAEWTGVLTRLARENGGGRRGLYVQVTRGEETVRMHAGDSSAHPTVFAMALPVREPAVAERGVSAITMQDTRWHNCDIKATALLANVLYRREAARQGADEALLVRDGLLTEGAASSVFVVNDNRVRTPPLRDILPGITRGLLINILGERGVDCREVSIPAVELPAADEIWLTGSTLEVTPVLTLDGQRVGTGLPGPLWRRALDGYREYLRARQGAARHPALHTEPTLT